VAALSIEQVLAQEAGEIHPQPSQQSLMQGLQAHAAGQPVKPLRARKNADMRSGSHEKPVDVASREAFYRALNKLNRAALCCSGGGIRSATFCLGVIQALAMSNLPKASAAADAARSTEDAVKEEANRCLLSRFHYLSTVSGGGYIGSWLSAWRQREDFPSVWRNLIGRPDGPDVEPPEISWLRAYSNYLTPRIGVFSADSWSAVAIYVRNLILNWLVIVPAVALALLALKVVATFSVAAARIEERWWPQVLIALVGIACLIVAQAFATSHRPTRRVLPGTAPEAEGGNIDQVTFLRRDLIWSLLSAVFLTIVLASQFGAELAGGPSAYPSIVVGAVLGVAIFAVGWLAGRPLCWQVKDFLRWAATGAVYGGLLGLGAHLFTLLSPYNVEGSLSIWIILLPVVLGIPWILISQVTADMIFVGLVSYQLYSDADREWLGRRAGWVAATAVIWAVTTFVVFAGGNLLIDVKSWLGPYVASVGGLAGIVGALIGKSAQTPAKPTANDHDIKAIAYKIGLAIAGPIFAAALVLGISVALDLLLLGDSLVHGLAEESWTLGYITWRLLIGLAAAGFVAVVAWRSVNINRFSLHALYRNRLVRAYLGASRQRRFPDLFTGFDEKDNLPVHELWPPKACPDGHNTLGLFHVVNITLNVVHGERLGWQERKAESFTVSPRHCGAAYKGFRPSSEYGGSIFKESRPDAPCGLSLGTAMAISGAAASPNMGYHSSPSVTLLLSLFNVRLGWWLGNPGPEGEATYKDEGPATAIVPLVQETFGLTTDDKPYVYLSDGGHFENLGLYEMVRRRCRFILAIDAGCDSHFDFADLGNAVRKIFIDLGIRITFEGLEELANRPSAERLSEAEHGIPYHAVGTIHYGDADGEECEDGTILYIKPALHGAEGAGVRSYAAAHKAFPHEPTADQWFSEAEFESYRSLGLDIMNKVLKDYDELDTILAGTAPTAHP
jgi:hypothetical protein